MTRLTKSRALALRAAEGRRLGELIDEVEPGAVDPRVRTTHRKVAALDAALAGAAPWARSVQVGPT
jgi:hypothetical protein